MTDKRRTLARATSNRQRTCQRISQHLRFPLKILSFRDPRSESLPSVIPAKGPLFSSFPRKLAPARGRGIHLPLRQWRPLQVSSFGLPPAPSLDSGLRRSDGLRVPCLPSFPQNVPSTLAALGPFLPSFSLMVRLFRDPRLGSLPSVTPAKGPLFPSFPRKRESIFLLDNGDHSNLFFRSPSRAIPGLRPTPE